MSLTAPPTFTWATATVSDMVFLRSGELQLTLPDGVPAACATKTHNLPA
jgi:hypothetical protein